MKTSFDTSENHLMTINGCSVGLHAPAALKSQFNNGEEMAHSLPPSRPRSAFLVDEFPACPADWLRSSGRMKSFFVPIVEGRGMWLDFNSCLHGQANDVAIVVSAQGVNAITGLPCRDAALEQYIDQCPKHKEPFGPDRLCKKCGFKWPKQNYLASTGTPHGLLWLDGFRSPDGKVRQYVFTSQKERGVAAAIIGEERVHALGISFFLSKAQRAQQPRARRRSSGICGQSVDSEWIAHLAPPLIDHTWDTCVNPGEVGCDLKFTCSTPPNMTANANSMDMLRCLDSSPKTRLASASVQHRAAPVTVKKLEIAAGARINQHVYDDPNALDYWHNEPTGLIVINYCSEEEARAIIAAGKADVNGSPEGFLNGLPVGNQ